MFTDRFPFAGGEQFLETEIGYLVERFEKVLLVPRFTQGSQRALPASVEVDTSLATLLPQGLKKHIYRMLSGLRSLSFYHELLDHRGLLHHPIAMYRAASYWHTACSTAQWLQFRFEQHAINPVDSIFYTYWLGGVSFGIGLLKSRYPNLRLVSRAHGADLYEERYKPAYQPFRAHTLKGLDLLALISEHGKNYIQQHWRLNNVQSEVYRLGVNDPGFNTQQSMDGVFRLVSCSYLVALKRLPLLIHALHILVENHPNLHIEWHHLGDGPLRADLESLAAAILPSVKWVFHGQLSNADILAFYRDNPVDVFVNVSETEGVPVSIMEAYSCGIPAIATAVGGVAELVSMENGILLDAQTSSRQIAEALAMIVFNPAVAADKRTLSKQTWQFFI